VVARNKTANCFAEKPGATFLFVLSFSLHEKLTIIFEILKIQITDAFPGLDKQN
jgi:hypothetical protein